MEYKAEKICIETEDGVLELQENWTMQCDSFNDMQLKNDLLRAVNSYGFERPSKIQRKAILPLIL